MNVPRRNIRQGLASLSRRERIILMCLLVLVAAFGTDYLFTKLYLERNSELKEAVAKAEEESLYFKRLLSREEMIHAQYKKLESPVVDVRDSVLTDTEVLRDIAHLAEKMVHVKSIVPRLGHHEGRQVMFVALDFEGPFEAVVGYVEKILYEMPSEVGSLSLAPGSGGGGGIICRLTLRVEYIES